MPSASRSLFPKTSALVALGGALLTAGCSQWFSPDYYNPPNESTQTDAVYQAEGGTGARNTSRAPSQLQIGLRHDTLPPQQGAAQAGLPAAETPLPPASQGGNATAAPAAAADHAEQRAYLPQAQTFLGTFPCAAPSALCQAQRITLTLAPNGRWRSRATPLSGQEQAAAAQTTDQGCWNVVNERPARVLLLDAHGVPRAELLASANNVLSLKSYLGRPPTLEYTLTRQPDLDPIDELKNQPLPACD
jgi:hypothetical protein